MLSTLSTLVLAAGIVSAVPPKDAPKNPAALVTSSGYLWDVSKFAEVKKDTGYTFDIKGALGVGSFKPPPFSADCDLTQGNAEKQYHKCLVRDAGATPDRWVSARLISAGNTENKAEKILDVSYAWTTDSDDTKLKAHYNLTGYFKPERQTEFRIQPTEVLACLNKPGGCLGVIGGGGQVANNNKPKENKRP